MECEIFDSMYDISCNVTDHVESLSKKQKKIFAIRHHKRPEKTAVTG